MTKPRFMSFSAAGRTGYGLAVADGVYDLSARFGARFPTLKDVVAANAFAELADAAAHRGPALPMTGLSCEIPILAPEKIICVGVNFPDRNEEYKDGQA